LRPARWLPLWWYLTLAALLLFGVFLICNNPQVPNWLLPLSLDIRGDAWSLLAGLLLVTSVLGHAIVFVAVRIMDELFGLSGESSVHDLWPATLVGIVEGLLYPIAILAGQPAFIGLWLGVKVAGQWGRWGTEFPPPSAEHAQLRRDRIIEAKKGRRRFNKFLVGNALRILLGGLTFLILQANVIVSQPQNAVP